MLVDLTDDALTRLTVDKTRRKSVHGAHLARCHRDVGRILAGPIANVLGTEACPIEHSTGAASGFHISPERRPTIVAVLRAGLFVAEGIWEALPGAALVPWNPETGQLPHWPKDRPVILVDGVINTGGTIRNLLVEADASSLLVATLVGYRPTMEKLAKEFGEVDFIAGRLSERTYVGKGGTDTGARLFGTTDWIGNE